jgi:hypothetical protein
MLNVIMLSVMVPSLLSLWLEMAIFHSCLSGGGNQTVDLEKMCRAFYHRATIPGPWTRSCLNLPAKKNEVYFGLKNKNKNKTLASIKMSGHKEFLIQPFWSFETTARREKGCTG